jgi:hypothetical protein
MLPSFQLNFLAVGAAALAAFLIGALWYSPALFARAWKEAHGYTSEQVQQMQQTAARAYVVSLLCYLVLAAALGVIVYYFNLRRIEQGLQLGLLAWGGFAVPLGLNAHVYSDDRPAAWLIDAGYQLVYLLVMGVILTLWR